jgi:hypothetical protein
LVAVGRAVLALAAFYAAFVALGWAAGWVQARMVAPEAAWRVAGRGLLALAAPPLLAVAAVYAVLIAVLRQPPRRCGIPGWRQGVRGLGVGVMWGAALAISTVLLCLGGGAAVLVRPGGEERFLAVAVPLAAGIGMSALVEELLFRGFPLIRLSEEVSPAAASAVLALIFAGAHAGNPAVSGLGLANVALASLLLSAAFFSAGGLATAFGLHLGWNAGLVFGADAPVSGLRFGLPALEFAPGPRGWWTGGRFGPEGGLAATVVLAAALVWWGRRFRRAEDGV